MVLYEELESVEGFFNLDCLEEIRLTKGGSIWPVY